MIPTSTLILLLLVPLIAWRLYRRYRRLVGRQRSRVGRHVAALVLFPLLAILLAVPLVARPLSLAALAAGLLVGGALAVFSLRTTRFEAVPEGFFYTPNARIGIALSLLMVARIGYRLFEMSTIAMAERAAHVQDFTRSPLTLVIFGMLAAYYSTYAFGLLRWRRSSPSPLGEGRGEGQSDESPR